ncbi:MAG: 3-isopropylmalate dehydratase small subunit 1 [Alphaproteobacteria bacterium MarineAlpha6_Bin1]|nr:MAG: 3-isopropylmalate dehydratase small subunit 1 [Alphaproteobacteria bacterium MarineAlpha6_Bin1]
MEKFTKLSGVAAPFTRINVDTDLIIPAEYLKTIRRTGLGKHLFSYIRYNDDGSQKKEFILNKAHYKKSIILITGKNFGCGSSREHAVWALKDFGIKCLIGAEFADIFYNNCFKNGILPIILNQFYINRIIKKISSEKTSMLTVDLKKQIIIMDQNEVLKFKVDSYRKKCLLEGLDDISLTLNKDTLISKYEFNLKKKLPWLDK